MFSVVFFCIDTMLKDARRHSRYLQIAIKESRAEQSRAEESGAEERRGREKRKE
jgi:hypothetical protein